MGRQLHRVTSCLFVDAFDLLDRSLQPPRRQKVRLLEIVEDDLVLPRRVVEALVALGWFGHRLDRLAHPALGGDLPQLHVLLPKLDLGLNQAVGIGHHLGREVHEGPGEMQGVCRLWAIGLVALGEVLQELLAAFGNVLERRLQLQRELRAELDGRAPLFHEPPEEPRGVVLALPGAQLVPMVDEEAQQQPRIGRVILRAVRREGLARAPEAPSGRCLEVHDLIASKLAAGRLKDYELVAVLLQRSLADVAIVRERIAAVADLNMRAVLLARLQIVLESAVS